MAERDRSGDGQAGRAILAYAPSRFAEPLLGLVALPILTRTLSTEAYGDLSVLLVTATFLRTLGYDWVANSALRFRTAMADRLDAFFPNVVAGLALSGAAVGVLLAAAVVALPQLGTGRAVALVAAFAGWLFLDAGIAALAYCGEMVLRATGRARAFTVSRVLQALSRHGLAVAALVAASGAFPAYFAARVVGLVLVASWSWRVVARGVGWRWSGVSAGVQREFLAFGLPLTVSLLAHAVRPVANRYVVLAVAGSESTGLYAAADSIGGMPLLVFQQVVMLGLYPLAIAAWERGESIEPIVSSGLRYYFLAGLPALAGLALLARPVLAVVAGVEYAAAAPALVLLAVSMLAFGVSQYFSIHFMVAKRTGVMAWISLAAGALNLALALWLVPRHGYVAAAAASAVANAALMVGMAIWGVDRWWRAVPWSALLRATASVAVMCGAVWAVGRWMTAATGTMLVTSVGVGVVTYAGVLILSGEVAGELSWLRSRLADRRGGGGA